MFARLLKAPFDWVLRSTAHRKYEIAFGSLFTTGILSFAYHESSVRCTATPDQPQSATDAFHISDQLRAKAQSKKMILVLDLDETLVHTRRQFYPQHNVFIQTQYQGFPMYIQTRPHLRQFMKSASELFTIFIYTAGTQRYADIVISLVDVNNVIKRRFYRDSCRRYNGGYIKDLKKIIECLAPNQIYPMILVDDNPDSIKFNAPNSIKIEAFEGNQTDAELVRVFQELVRKVNNDL